MRLRDATVHTDQTNTRSAEFDTLTPGTRTRLYVSYYVRSPSTRHLSISPLRVAISLEILHGSTQHVQLKVSGWLDRLLRVPDPVSGQATKHCIRARLVLRWYHVRTTYSHCACYVIFSCALGTAARSTQEHQTFDCSVTHLITNSSPGT